MIKANLVSFLYDCPIGTYRFVDRFRLVAFLAEKSAQICGLHHSIRNNLRNIQVRCMIPPRTFNGCFRWRTSGARYFSSVQDRRERQHYSTRISPMLDEIQLPIDRCGFRFVLTGSSARKLMRAGTNLLGGHARVRHLFPLTSREIGALDLPGAFCVHRTPRLVNGIDVLPVEIFLQRLWENGFHRSD